MERHTYREAGGDPRYTEFAGVDHASWIPAYQTAGLYEWLFAQRRRAPTGT